MSLQTTVLVNGTRAARTVDIGELLSRSRESDYLLEDTAICKSSVTGVLSRTLINGPAVQWILPARLRHQDQNDVVFIGDKFIQIKELVASGHLEEVITKSDFDSRIVGAKIINSRPEPSLDDEIRQGREAQSCDSRCPSDRGVVPPHILVLVLSSKEVLFVFTKEGPLGCTEFVYSRRPLPADTSALEEYGRHVAVEPQSRALAICAAQRFFGVFTLKPSLTIQDEMTKGPVNPIQEECFFRAEGEILRLEFLYPTPPDNDRIVLLLLISQDSGNYFVIYDWNASENIRSIDPRVTSIRFADNYRIPTVLIPLIHSTSFMVATHSSLFIYKNILNPAATTSPVKCSIPTLEDRPRSANQIWTQWARARRNRTRSKLFDDIYLCREDGMVVYLEIEKGGDISRQSNLGSLGCNLDTAFAILPEDYQAGDVLVTAGSMCGGGLFIEDARKPLRCIQRIPNWGPILDTIAVKADRALTSLPKNYHQQMGLSFDRLFTCSGVGPDHGTISELRYGIEAQIGLTIEHGPCSSITGVWGIPAPKAEGTLCLFTDPMMSSLIFIPVNGNEEGYAMDEEQSGLDLNHQTLAAGITPDGVVMQVTEVSIRLTHVGLQQRSSITWEDVNDRTIFAYVNSARSLIAIAMRNGNDIRVELRTIRSVGGEDGIVCPLVAPPLSLTQEPICFAIEEIYSQQYLLIGTSGGKVVVVKINELNGLAPFLEHSIRMGKDDTDFPVCESLRLVTTVSKNQTRLTLFCGLRSGHLVPINIKQESLSFKMEQMHSQRIGETAVRLGGYETDESFAVVSCASNLWRLSHSPNEYSPYHSLEKIWITDQSKPEKMQPIVNVFDCISTPTEGPPTGLSGSLLCITGDTLIACRLESIAKAVPREIRVRGNPKRIVYSKYLKMLIVAYNRVDFDFTPSTEGTKRWIWPKIGFLDPDGEAIISSSIDLRATGSDFSSPTTLTHQPVGASGEKITALLDWRFYGEGHEYHMIVVGTAYPLAEYKKGKEATVDYKGRVVYITVRQNPPITGNIDCKTKRIHNYDQPIRAIVSYGPSSLLIAYGDDILMQTLDPRSRKWRSLEPHRLESHAVSISVKEPYIYVLTSRHSLCILQASEDGLLLKGQAGADKGGLDHVNLRGEANITLTANRGGSLVGLIGSGHTDDTLLRPIFSANTPSAVVRVNHSHRPDSKGAGTIFGTTLDGTLYRLQTLLEHEWRILRFIQSACLVDANICPFRRKRRVVLDEVSPLLEKAEHMHIDGDILARLISRGAGYLEEMMRGGAGEKRLERFLEFARLVVGETNNPFTHVMLWMENKLRVEI